MDTVLQSLVLLLGAEGNKNGWVFNGDVMEIHGVKTCQNARCNGPAVFGCFARRPKSRFEDPCSTLCFFPLCTCSISYVNYRVSGFESRNSTAWKDEH